METVELVQVIWDDACHVRSPKEAKTLKMMSFGLLLKDEKEGVVLAQSQSEVGEFIDCLFIPRGIIVDVNKIPLPADKGSLAVFCLGEAGRGRA